MIDTALTDVNVLALLDRGHVATSAPEAWITGQIERGWASCAITGLSRVSQPLSSPISAGHAIDLLARATYTYRVLVLHRQKFSTQRVVVVPACGPKQVTDACGPHAVAHDGRFVASIGALTAVPGTVAKQHLATLWARLRRRTPKYP